MDNQGGGTPRDTRLIGKGEFYDGINRDGGLRQKEGKDGGERGAPGRKSAFAACPERKGKDRWSLEKSAQLRGKKKKKTQSGW